MLSELNLDTKYSHILEENGFDEWASVSEIEPPLLKEMGIANEIDCMQIMACVEAAKKIQEEEGTQQQYLQSEILEESEMMDNFDSYEGQYDPYGQYNESNNQGYDQTYETDFGANTLGHQLKNEIEPVKAIKLSIKGIERAAHMKKMQKDTPGEFRMKVLSLFLNSKGYTQIVSFLFNFLEWFGRIPEFASS